MVRLPSLATFRLRLRPCERGDAAALHAIWTDRGVRRYLWDDAVIAREQALETVERAIDRAERGLGLWVVLPRDRERMIGFCALDTIGSTSDVELLYGLLPIYWGQGLATEASRTVMRYGFEVLDLPAIWARTDAPNVDSVSVMVRLGMSPVERLDSQGLVCYRLTRAEFAAAP